MFGLLKKPLVLTLISVWWPAAVCAGAAEGKVVGFVVDALTGEPVNKANVYLAKTGLGTVADEKGYFKIDRVPAGKYVLVAARVGYRKMLVQNVQVASAAVRSVRVQINRAPIQMGDLQVTARRTPPNFEYQASLAGHEMIQPRLILRRSGAMEDAYRSLKALPGVVNRNDMNTQLYIRGSSPDQNLILYDGIEVTNPNRLMVMMGGGISLVNPDIVQTLDLAPAGFEVDHGNKMSALLQIGNREGSREQTKFNASANLLFARAVAEGPLAKGSGSWLVAARRSFYDVLANSITENRYVFPFYYDVHAKIAYDLSSQYKLSAFYTHLGEGAKMINVEDEQLDLLNSGRGEIAGMRLTTVFSPKWMSHLFAGLYLDRNRVHIRDTYFYRYQVYLNYQLERWSLRSDTYYYPHPWLQFKFGAEADRHNTDLLWSIDWRNAIDLPSDITFDAGGWHEAGYAEARIKVKKSIEWVGGMRYDHSTLYREGHVNPRVKMLFTAFSPLSFWCSYGRYSQFPDFLTIISRGEPLDISQNTSELAAEHATHAIVGGQWLVTPQTLFKCELYHKRFTDLLVHTDAFSIAPVNEGLGLAKGVEVSFQKLRQPQDRWGGWLNYTLAETQYRNSAQEPWIYYEYDQTHQWNLGVEMRLNRRWSVEGAWYYGSGFPYTPVLGVQSGTSDLDFDAVIKGEKNSKRYPYYSRLDLRVSYESTLGGVGYSAYLDVVNVLNRKNIYMYDWRLRPGNRLTRNVYYMLPLLPSLGMSIRL